MQETSPVVPGFVITQKIFGPDGDLCHIDQTVPPAMLYDCKHSKESIAYLSSDEVRNATKPGSRAKIKIGPDGTEASAGGVKLKQDQAQRECRMVIDEAAIKKLAPAEQDEMRKTARLLEESRLK